MKKSLRILFIIFLLFDLIFSFTQHYHKSLDGDMATIVLGYPEVMNDPFGMNVVLHQQVYGGTNRFFAHWSMSQYFKTAPLVIQNFTSPIESIYISCAFVKTIIQAIIILALAFLISGSKDIRSFNFLLSAVLITPLFQTNGYSGYMGIINASITYAFFYSFWIAMTLLFLTCIYKYIFKNDWNTLTTPRLTFLFCFSIVLALGGPLNAAIILIGMFVILLRAWYKNTTVIEEQKSILRIPRNLLLLSSLTGLVCLYSIYLGTFNAENFFHNIPLSERYAVLPTGLINIFTQKLGPVLLLLTIILNLILISRIKEANGNYILHQAKWIGLFILIYILILPFGGFREYRPNIVRSDTFLPVIICMIYLFVATILFLLNRQFRMKSAYITFIFFIALIFTVADKSVKRENDCEKSALSKIALSNEKIIELGNDCTVMSWYKITDPVYSRINCELLKIWCVTNEEKTYFQK
jgi:hypothetical protein